MRPQDRVIQTPAPEPSSGHYAEAKDLVKRIDPENGLCEWAIGKRSWHVRVGTREAYMPFENGCALDHLYVEKHARPTNAGDYHRQLHPDAVFRLVAIMELHAV